MKPIFPDKEAGKSDIALIEGDKSIQEDSEVANIMNDFLGKALSSLNIGIPSEYITDESVGIDDPIEKIISKYSNSLSIELINENVLKGNFTFKAMNLVDIEKEVKALDSNKSTMSGSILKLADLIPVNTDDDITNQKNYRNISLLPIVSKIFEKIMQSKISAYVENFLSPFLCGYRTGFSAQRALLSMLEKGRNL